MGRRPRDVEYENAQKKLASAWNDPYFQLCLSRLWEFWEVEVRELGGYFLGSNSMRRFIERGLPPGVNKDDWLYSNLSVMGLRSYSGAYYDLRELCDQFGLPWPICGRLLVSYLLSGEEATSNTSILQQDSCPPAHHWRWFRIARTGLGRVTPDEIAQIDDRLRFTATGRPRDFQRGFPYEVIAELDSDGQTELDESTIRKAVKNCEEYLLRGDIGRIADFDDVIMAGGPFIFYIWSFIKTHDSQSQKEENNST